MRIEKELGEMLKSKNMQAEFLPEDESSELEISGPEVLNDGIPKIIKAIQINIQTKGAIFANEKLDANNKLILKGRASFVYRAMRLSSEYEIAKDYYAFSPYIDAFFNCLSLHFLSVEMQHDKLQGANNFAAALYAELNGEYFKNLLKSRERAVNKLSKGFMDYIDKLFLVRSRLLVIRIDLSCKQATSSPDDTDLMSLVENQRSHSQVIHAHLRSLLNTLKKKGSPYAMVGYAWKLEYGFRKGFHYHLMLFLDGSKNREHIHIGKAIGKLWSENITAGLGGYWNCVGTEFYYKSCGVGMVGYDEPKKILNVKHAAAYLVKLDRWVSAYLPDGKRCFGKGVITVPIGKKRGRPRNE